jgi:hypothetical protein
MERLFRESLQETRGSSPEVIKLWGVPPGGSVRPLGGRDDCIRYIFVLNEIRVQGKTHIFIGT